MAGVDEGMGEVVDEGGDGGPCAVAVEGMEPPDSATAPEDT